MKETKEIKDAIVEEREDEMPVEAKAEQHDEHEESKAEKKPGFVEGVKNACKNFENDHPVATKWGKRIAGGAIAILGGIALYALGRDNGYKEAVGDVCDMCDAANAVEPEALPEPEFSVDLDIPQVDIDVAADLT